MVKQGATLRHDGTSRDLRPVGKLLGAAVNDIRQSYQITIGMQRPRDPSAMQLGQNWNLALYRFAIVSKRATERQMGHLKWQWRAFTASSAITHSCNR